MHISDRAHTRNCMRTCTCAYVSNKHACKCTDRQVCFRTHTFDSCLLASTKLPENACVGIDLCMRFLLVRGRSFGFTRMHFFGGKHAHLCVQTRMYVPTHMCDCGHRTSLDCLFNYLSCLPQGPKKQINCRIFTMASKGMMSGRIHCVFPRN